MAFAIDTKNLIVNNACYILTGGNLEYLLMVLNSNIIKWYSYQTNMNKTGVGDVQVGGQNLMLFPIPIISKSEQELFIQLLDKLLNEREKKANISIIETEINKTIYKLYNLDIDEINFIENQ